MSKHAFRFDEEEIWNGHDCLYGLDTGLSADSGKSETRREKAFRAIEGREAPTFGTNPWRPIFDFDATATNQILAQGGAAIKLEISDPLDFLDSERIALLWDDSEVADGPRNVEEGSTIVMKSGPPKGKILSIWATDSSLSIRPTLEKPDRASDIQREIEQNEKADKAKRDATDNPVEKAINRAVDAYKVIGLAGVVVAGFVAYFYLKGR